MDLADLFPEHGLAPEPRSIERAAYLQWWVYSAGTLEPAMTAASQASQGYDKAHAYGTPTLEKAMDVIANGLGDRTTLLASGFSTANVVLGSTVLWVKIFGMDISALEPLQRDMDALMSRPSFANCLGGG